MKKIFIASFLIFVFLQTASPSTATKESSTLEKYLIPAKITKLDWILLKIQMSSFTQEIRWDDFGLLNSVDLFVAYVEEKPYVGLTFLVNNSQYIRIENHVAEKIFRNAIDTTVSIIKINIPELEQKKDIFANFIIVTTSKIAAKYVDGKFEFIE